MESMQDKKNKEEKIEKEPKVYELGYLLVPTLSEEEEMPRVYGDLKELVSSLGGVFIMDEMPKMIDLAYEMEKVFKNVRSKYTNAYFGWIKFDMEPDQIDAMKEKLDLDGNVLRYLVTKTVRENTIAGRKFGVTASVIKKAPEKPAEEGEPAAEIDDKEIDKEIDAMVAAE